MDSIDTLNSITRNENIDTEFATPQDPPSSPFSPPSNATDIDFSSRLRKADKERRFQRYMLLNNVKALSVDNQQEDADEFYDGHGEGSSDVIYLKDGYTRPSTSGTEGDQSAINAYEVYDVHKRRKIDDDSNGEDRSLKYDDTLVLKDVRQFEIDLFDSIRFKNNLVDSYKDYLFVGSQSKILVLKNEKLIRSLEVSPAFTTRRDRGAATWSFFPHTLNYIKVSKLEDRYVLCCAVDDGRTLIYDIEDVFVKKTRSDPRYELKLSSSVWGVDTYKNMVAVSDNSQTVTLFYTKDNEIYYHTSTQVIHNIPDVSFVETDKNDPENVVYVSCVSISGEFIIFKFEVFTMQGPLREPSKEYSISIDTVEIYLNSVTRYRFRSQVFSRIMLQEDSWATHFIHDRYFKEVNSPEELGGKETIDIGNILKNSKALKLTTNHLISSDLGAGAWYEDIQIDTSFDRHSETEFKLNRFTDKFARIKKSYFSVEDDQFTSALPKSPHHEKFLFVATATKVGIYRFNKLVCNATSGKLYDFSLHEELRFSNRLSITRVIPEISAIVAISQAGFISIFRLVKYRGLHSLRQEIFIPKSDTSSFETIVGLGVRKLDHKVYWLYVVYSDGRTVIYELTENDDNDSLSAMFI